MNATVLVCENPEEVCAPTCGYVAQVQALLVPWGARLGLWVLPDGRATPNIFVRAIIPGFPPSVIVVPRYCPFCGDPYDLLPRGRSAPSPPVR